MADIAVSVAKGVVTKVAEYLVAPVGRHCGYLIFSHRNIRQLEDAVVKLGYERAEVQDSIDEARNNMKRVTPRVERWVVDVDTVANQAQDVLNNNRTAETTCFCGWLPNPKARYDLGKDASRSVKDIQELIQQIQQGELKKVDLNNPPMGRVVSSPNVNLLVSNGDNTITGSRLPIFQSIMNALDDEKHKVIGIYGRGGVGKTTLLREIEKKLRNEGRPFEMIVKAEVLQTADVDNIQRQIADALNLNLEGKQSQQGRRDLLCQRLQKDPNEKVLIILDDLWGRT